MEEITPETENPEPRMGIWRPDSVFYRCVVLSYVKIIDIGLLLMS